MTAKGLMYLPSSSGALSQPFPGKRHRESVKSPQWHSQTDEKGGRSEKFPNVINTTLMLAGH